MPSLSVAIHTALAQIFFYGSHCNENIRVDNQHGLHKDDLIREDSYFYLYHGIFSKPFVTLMNLTFLPYTAKQVLKLLSVFVHLSWF